MRGESVISLFNDLKVHTCNSDYFSLSLHGKHRITNQMEMSSLIAECTAYDFKVTLEDVSFNLMKTP